MRVMPRELSTRSMILSPARGEKKDGLPQCDSNFSVELVTGICHTVPEAVADLAHKLSHVRAAADEMGVKLWASE